MTTLELLQSIQDALASSSEIQNYCFAEFGRNPKIYLGVDPNNLPSSDADYPLIAITGITQSRGDKRPTIDWQIDVAIVIVQETIEQDVDKITYKGFKQLEELREIVENAIYKAKILPADTDSEFRFSMQYPRSMNIIGFLFSLPRTYMSGLGNS